MTFASFLLSYGYIAVFIGTFLEGETILVMAGFAAHSGYLNLYWVIGIAIIGSFLGDQLFFYLGARFGWRILNRFPTLKPRADRVHVLLDRYHLPLILGVRFMYGLRIVGPLVIGMSSVNWLRFFVLNLLGAIVWAWLIGGAGYLFGHALELMLADLQHYEEMFLMLIVLAGMAVWLGYRWRNR